MLLACDLCPRWATTGPRAGVLAHLVSGEHVSKRRWERRTDALTRPMYPSTVPSRACGEAGLLRGSIAGEVEDV